MSTLSYSKHTSSVGTFPIAFSIITFTLQLVQVFISPGSSSRLTVARKASPSPSPIYPTFIPTPTVPCLPTPTLPSDHPDASTTARPLLASLVLVVLSMLVFASSTYIRRKSGTIFTPLIPPSTKDPDPPQPLTPPDPHEDDSSAADEDGGEENEDGDDDRDTPSEDDDESDDSSNGDPDDPDDPDDPSSDSNVEDPPSPPIDPEPWDILLLGILYLTCIVTLTKKLSSTLLRRIINTMPRRLNDVSNQITVNFGKIVDCVLVWLDQSLLQLYDEMMWINNEQPLRPVFDIGMRNLGPKCTPITLHATDELHELKQALLNKTENVSQASSTWASKVCPFFRGNNNLQSSRTNDTITSNMTWSRARPLYSPFKDDVAIPKPTTTSPVHGILSTAMVYGAIGALIQVFGNAHARRARNRQEFDQEGSTLFNENASSAIVDGSADGENEDPEEEATHSNLQGPDSVTANERCMGRNSEREHGYGSDGSYVPEDEELPDTSDSAIAYITALSISTFASVEERIHECTNISTNTTPFSIVSPIHVTSTKERTHKDECCGNLNSSTTTDNYLLNNGPARVEIPHTYETPNFDLAVTLPPSGSENIEAREEEDGRAQEYYIQEEDWYEEAYIDKYLSFYEDRECETNLEEFESFEEGGRYVEEEDVYEEENLYGDEYPGFYRDIDSEWEEHAGENNEEEFLNDENAEEGFEETDMDIEEAEPSNYYIRVPETSPKDLQPTSNKDHALKMTRMRYVEGEAELTVPQDREVITFQMAQLDKGRQYSIEEEVHLQVAGDSAYYPDEEPIEGSDISIYFRRRPSSRFQYTEEDSLEEQSAAPTLLTSIAEERVVQTRALVEKAYSSHNYDPSQIDALTYWHLCLKDEEDAC